MAERVQKRKSIIRSSSTESTDYSLTMGRSIRDKKKKPKERWLLTRKTWRYMADAGRKLIPEGAQNRPEDLPKIEAYFQEVCKKEPRFLLWRKNSYPGALAFRTKKRKMLRKGGSCRKACSADDVDLIRPDRPKDLAIIPTSSGRFDLQKMKHDFLHSPPDVQEEAEEKQLINMLEQYLTISDKPPVAASVEFNYQELVDKLQRHLTLASRNVTAFPSYPTSQRVHFTGDYVQKSLSETLSRYFSQSQNRQRVVSDLLTDRKMLERLYFELRRTKGFRGGRGGGTYTPSSVLPQTTSRFELLKERERKTGTVHPPPLIEIESETFEVSRHDWGVQTLPVPESVLREAEERYRQLLAEQEEEKREERAVRRRSSVDNDDISQSVSDTIKRYLRMARKKSVDTEKADRFKRVNYDRNLRNIKAKGEITKPGDDDGLSKGCQTSDEWMVRYRDLKFDEVSESESRMSSSRSSIDVGVVDENNKSSPSSPPPVVKSQSFLSHLLHGSKHEKVVTASGAAQVGQTMQKSKSSSSVMHHGSRLMAKKIFRSRSKSQTRPPPAACSWTPQGGCVWTSLTGRQVILGETSLLQLTEVERKVLQRVALAKLQALNLGVAIRMPTESVGAVVAKPKRRPYLLKRKALTTSIFDTSRKEGEKDGGSSGGLVFGIPLVQCVENDRLSRGANRTSPFRSRAELSGTTSDAEAPPIGRHGSRSSFSSLIEPPNRGDESGSCESLMYRDRIVGSFPGLLDGLSCGGSTGDLRAAEEEAAIPNVLNACFKHLEQYGLRTLGIFRVSTSKKRIRQLREDFDCGKETTLDSEQCPHDVATLLKEYLRDLPDPLLGRHLYQAFVQTQRIRNRRLQFEALQHLIQLLPAANRDTLFSLLTFLALVAQNSTDVVDEAGEVISGNKMDSNNLATVFAPNILHCIKPGGKETADRPEDRIDIINVVRALIDHYKQIFTISAEMLDEIYVHMMDSHPEALDLLLEKKDAIAAADESVEEVDSESYSATWSPVGKTPEMSIESIQADLEPKRTYSREECLHEAAATGGPNVGMRIRHKDRIRERSSRKRRDESAARRKLTDESVGVSLSSGITSAIISRFRAPKDDDPHFGKQRSSSLESAASSHADDRRPSAPHGVITASLTIPLAAADDDDIPYIEEADCGRQQLTIGLVRAPAAPPRRRQRSASGSDSSASLQPHPASCDSAVGSSVSPVQNTSSTPPSWASSPPTSPDSAHTTVNYIPEQRAAAAPSLQKVSFSLTQEVQQVRQREPKFTPSITSIGDAVLRSRTADFERKSVGEGEKKKYTKRRYTEARHQTRHIPDADALEAAVQSKREEGAAVATVGPVYKRRELISSVPSK